MRLLILPFALRIKSLLFQLRNSKHYTEMPKVKNRLAEKMKLAILEGLLACYILEFSPCLEFFFCLVMANYDSTLARFSSRIEHLSPA